MEADARRNARLTQPGGCQVPLHAGHKNGRSLKAIKKRLEKRRWEGTLWMISASPSTQQSRKLTSNCDDVTIRTERCPALAAWLPHETRARKQQTSTQTVKSSLSVRPRAGGGQIKNEALSVLCTEGHDCRKREAAARKQQGTVVKRARSVVE